jgi:hypothetical protein
MTSIQYPLERLTFMFYHESAINNRQLASMRPIKIYNDEKMPYYEIARALECALTRRGIFSAFGVLHAARLAMPLTV